MRRTGRWGRAAAMLVAACSLDSAAAGDLVISQVYLGAALPGATHRADFVELRNRADAPAPLAGLRLCYLPAAGNNWTSIALAGVVPARGYFTLRLAERNTTAAPVPADQSWPRFVSPGGARFALVRAPASPSSGVLCPTDNIEDFLTLGLVGCAPNDLGAPAAAPALAAVRRDAGCEDSGIHVLDWTTQPPAPRTTAAPPGAPCRIGPDLGFASASVSPDPLEDVGFSPLTYALRVRNAGRGAAGGVTLAVDFGEGSTAFNLASSPPGTVDGVVLHVPLGTVPAGAEIDVLVFATPAEPGAMTVRCLLTGSPTDENAADNQTVLTSRVGPAPLACNVADVVGIGGFPPPDFELTVDDYTSFINAFAGAEPLADIVSIGGFPPSDGELTVDDYTSFINAFAEGCG